MVKEPAPSKCYRCKADLREAARYCTECNCYQTRLRFIPTVPLVQSLVTLFSLIVNVVAVGTLAWNAAATDQDKVVIQLVSVDPKREQVVLLALNSGTRAAALKSAKMVAPPSYAAQTTAPAWQLNEPDDKVLLPGSARQITLDANAVPLPYPANGLDKTVEFRVVIDILRASGRVASHDLRYQGVIRN